MNSAENILIRDRNHPCIIAWDFTLNDVHYPKEIVKEILDLCEEETIDMFQSSVSKDGYNHISEFMSGNERQTERFKAPILKSDYGYKQNSEADKEFKGQQLFAGDEESRSTLIQPESYSVFTQSGVERHHCTQTGSKPITTNQKQTRTKIKTQIYDTYLSSLLTYSISFELLKNVPFSLK